MQILLQDLRYGARMLMKHPGFTLVAVLTLSLGIGANACVFSVLEAVLIKPLPFHEPDRLVWLANTNPSLGVAQTFLNGEDILDYREQAKSFAQIASWGTYPVNLYKARKPERVESIYVTPNFFQTLGVKPMLGRDFTPEDAVEEEDIVIISYGLWQRQFGADPDVIGRKIRLGDYSDEPYVIIGVMPADMCFPERVDMFTTFERQRDGKHGGDHTNRTIGRLKPGVTLDQAQAEISAIARRQAEQFPDTNKGWDVMVVPFRERFFGRVNIALPVLFGAVLCVLLIACANIANLQLVRAAGRTPEFAVRLALGAGCWRIVRQLMVENLLLFAVGGAAGLLVALWGIDALRALGADSIPRLKDATINAGALAFTAFLTALTGVISGLLPAMQSSKVDLNVTLKIAGSAGATPSRRQRIRGALVVSQFALAMALVMAAGLLMKSLLKLRQVDLGFQPEQVVTAGVSLNLPDYKTPAQRTRFFQQALERVRNLPGVEAAAAVSHLPLGGRTMQVPFRIAGSEQAAKKSHSLADYRTVTPAFFETMRILIKRGRDFTVSDNTKTSLVFVINDALARTYFPGGNPIGERLVLGSDGAALGEIVGIVGDVKHRAIEAEAFPTIYVCYLQDFSSVPNFVIMNYVVRAKTAPGALAERVGRELQSLDPNQVIFNVGPMERMIADMLAERRFTLSLLAMFSALALALAAVGIYGSMSYSVARRTREIGIRMALGARSSDLIQGILGQGLRMALIGMGVGAAITFASTRLIESLLYGVSARDPFLFALIAALLTMAALLACYLPARRAAKVDPMEALRRE